MNLWILFSLFLHSFDRDSCIVSIVFTVLSSALLDLMLELNPASSESPLWEEDVVLLCSCLVPLGPPPAPSRPSCIQECPEFFSTWSSVIAVTLPIIYLQGCVDISLDLAVPSSYYHISHVPLSVTTDCVFVKQSVLTKELYHGSGSYLLVPHCRSQVWSYSSPCDVYGQQRDTGTGSSHINSAASATVILWRFQSHSFACHWYFIILTIDIIK